VAGVLVEAGDGDLFVRVGAGRQQYGAVGFGEDIQNLTLGFGCRESFEEKFWAHYAQPEIAGFLFENGAEHVKGSCGGADFNRDGGLIGDQLKIYCLC
jgi:hypothetical protein